MKNSIDAYRACAEGGLSATQAAERLGVSKSAVYVAAKRYGLIFARDYSRNCEAYRERMKALNADPEYNPLVMLTAAERADYDLCVSKGRMTRQEALASIGRSDIMDCARDLAGRNDQAQLSELNVARDKARAANG